MIKIGETSYPDFENALADLKAGDILDLGKETICGQFVIDKDNVTVRNGTFRGNLGAYEILNDGYKRGTFRTYTLFIDADHVRLEHVKVINDNGYQDGQAIALMVDGEDLYAKQCVISSYQDSLFIAPLPEEEYEVRGFAGPLEKRARIMRHACFESCLIEGSVDFIFGGGEAFFENCEIRSRNIHKPINGYVCAPGTPEKERYGMVFDHCEFTCEEGMEDSVYLARPWRDHGKCLIVGSKIGSHIKKEAYHDWNKPEARNTSEFKEYGNSDGNSMYRVEWMKQVTDDDLQYIETLKRRRKG